MDLRVPIVLGLLIAAVAVAVFSKNLSSSAPGCVDTGTGSNRFARGTCSSGGKTYQDFCDYGATYILYKFYCSNGQCTSRSHLCPDGYECRNGACLNITSY